MNHLLPRKQKYDEINKSDGTYGTLPYSKEKVIHGPIDIIGGRDLIDEAYDRCDRFFGKKKK